MKYFIVLVLIWLTGCNTPDSYKYQEGIVRYLTHGLNLKKPINGHFYFINLNSCEPCVKANLSLLSAIAKPPSDLTVVFIGSTSDQYLSSQADIIKKKVRCIEDKQNVVLQYETGIGKPLLVRIYQGKITNHFIIADNETAQVRSYILTLNK